MNASCLRCNVALESSALEGLCPRCLLAQALPLEMVTTASTTFVPPTPAELAARFPQLEILELLGQGGMGAVYKARQIKLDRPVALKILPPAMGRDASFAERFTREARALARLSHPHIVGVHDFGDTGGLYYLLMEYVDGVNLRQAMTSGKLAPAQALALVGDLCSALQYAHEMGVVHRDIKPENVLLDRQGRVKVADFGLAKLIGQPSERLTGTGQAMGTPHYMAPEQWERPLEVDHRADIYSLGIVFYELLTGELPLGKFAMPSEKSGDARLDPVVLRAIEKAPEQRYQHMSEMKSAVEAVEQPVPNDSASPHKVLSWPLELAITLPMVAVVACLMVGLAGLDTIVGEVKFHNAAFVALSGAVIALCVASYSDIDRNLNRFGALVLLGLVILCWIKDVPAGCFLFCPALVGVVVLWGSFETNDRKVVFAPDPAPEPGFTPQETALLQFLRSDEIAGLASYELAIVPHLEGDLLDTARRSAKVPPDEPILAVLDLGDEANDGVLLIGCRGIYWHNGKETPHPGTGTLSCAELATRRFINHGKVVYLGQDQYLCPNEDETGHSAESLTKLLQKLSDWTVAHS